MRSLSTEYDYHLNDDGSIELVIKFAPEVPIDKEISFQADYERLHALIKFETSRYRSVYEQLQCRSFSTNICTFEKRTMHTRYQCCCLPVNNVISSSRWLNF